MVIWHWDGREVFISIKWKDERELKVKLKHVKVSSGEKVSKDKIEKQVIGKMKNYG